MKKMPKRTNHMVDNNELAIINIVFTAKSIKTRG